MDRETIIWLWGGFVFSLPWALIVWNLAGNYAKELDRIDRKWARAASWSTLQRNKAWLEGLQTARLHLVNRGFEYAASELDPVVDVQRDRLDRQERAYSAPPQSRPSAVLHVI